jgi:hypothetical protein
MDIVGLTDRKLSMGLVKIKLVYPFFVILDRVAEFLLRRQTACIVNSTTQTVVRRYRYSVLSMFAGPYSSNSILTPLPSPLL